jgi:hypothetical protein
MHHFRNSTFCVWISRLATRRPWAATRALRRGNSSSVAGTWARADACEMGNGKVLTYDIDEVMDNIFGRRSWSRRGWVRHFLPEFWAERRSRSLLQSPARRSGNGPAQQARREVARLKIARPTKSQHNLATSLVSPSRTTTQFVPGSRVRTGAASL